MIWRRYWILEIQAAHIGGISYGAEVSMVFALKYPDRTKTLIIADGVSEIQPLLKHVAIPGFLPHN